MLGAALLATVVVFLLPIRYEAKIVLLPPAQNTSLGSALLGQLGNMGALGSRLRWRVAIWESEESV